MTDSQRNPERDDHLLAALRHAPDRDVSPPPSVSEAILRQAQAAVRRPVANAPVNEPRRSAGLASLLASLNALLRPAPAAAFGTLAVAGIVGLMWATHEPPGVADEAPVAVAADASVPLAAPAPAPTSAAASALASAAMANGAAPSASQPATPATQPAATPPKPAAASKKAPMAAPREPKPASPATTAEAGPTARIAGPEVSEAATGAAAPVADSPPPASVNKSLEASRAVTLSGQRVAPPPSPAPQSAARAAPSASHFAGNTPLDRVLSLTAGDPSLLERRSRATETQEAATAATLQWRAADGRVRAHGAPQQQWLLALREHTAGTWLPPMPVGEPAPARAPDWVLLRNGAAIGSVWLEASAVKARADGGDTRSTAPVVWRDDAGAIWRGFASVPSNEPTPAQAAAGW